MSQNQSDISVRMVTSEEDISKVEELATEIWTEHYTPIIGIEQVEYMLGNFQSFDAIEKQISEGMSYFLLNYKGEPSGYLACKSEGEDLFLSKIYVLFELRGKGMGSYAMEFLSSLAREKGSLRLSLTVNKNNTNSIRAYEKLGFVNLGPLETDIGGGFVMDDYVMKKTL